MTKKLINKVKFENLLNQHNYIKDFTRAVFSIQTKEEISEFLAALISIGATDTKIQTEAESFLNKLEDLEEGEL